MKVIPGFTAMIGKKSFVKNKPVDHDENTLEFLKKCKLNDGSRAYPFEVITEKKESKKIIKGDRHDNS